MPGPGHLPASQQQCSAPPPRPLTSGLSFPGELRLKARAGKRRRWRPFHPPRGRSSSLPPGPHVEPRFPGGLSALPPAPRGQGEAGGLELARALPLSAPAPGRVPSRVWGGGFPQGPSTYRGRLRRRTPGLPPERLRILHRRVSPQSRSRNRSAGNRSAGNGSAPAHEGGAASPEELP